MLPFVTPWVDLKGIMPGEVTETDKQCMSSLNVQNLKKLTSGKQRAAEGWAERGGGPTVCSWVSLVG